MIMRDSVDPFAIPTDCDVVAGYGDGLYKWSDAGWNRFTCPKLVIAVTALDKGDVLDVERYNATPADVPGWIDRWVGGRWRLPVIYSSRSVKPQIDTAAAGRKYDWWCSTLDGTQNVPGAVAVQYVDTGSYDESVI